MATNTGSHGSNFQSTITIPASSAHSVLGTSSGSPSVLVHDFATGPFSTKVKLQFPYVFSRWIFQNGVAAPYQSVPGGTGLPVEWTLEGVRNTNSSGQFQTVQQFVASPGIGPNSPRLLRKNGYPGGFSILLDQKGQGNPNDFVVNLTSIHQNDGLKFTRTLCYDQADTTNIANNALDGDYSLTYSSPGLYEPNFVLYSLDYYVQSTANYTRYNNIYEEYTGNETPGNFSGNYYDAKKFYINLRQKNVPVVKKDNSSGATLVNGQIITGMSPSGPATIVLDKSLSRFPPGGSSGWIVWRQTSSGSLVVASPGVHYQLTGGETLNSNLIHLTWLTSGQFRVTAYCVDPGPGLDYQPPGFVNIDFPVNTATVNTINFPTVQAVVNPTSVFTNVVTSLSPLIGVQQLEISVSAILDLTNAVWTQKIDSNPPTTFSLTDPDWRAAMDSRTTVVCRVKKAGTNTLVAQRTGFGPHVFNLIAGNYDVGYSIIPLSNNVADLTAIMSPNLQN